VVLLVQVLASILFGGCSQLATCLNFQVGCHFLFFWLLTRQWWSSLKCRQLLNSHSAVGDRLLLQVAIWQLLFVAFFCVGSHSAVLCELFVAVFCGLSVSIGEQGGWFGFSMTSMRTRNRSFVSVILLAVGFHHVGNTGGAVLVAVIVMALSSRWRWLLYTTTAEYTFQFCSELLEHLHATIKEHLQSHWMAFFTCRCCLLQSCCHDRGSDQDGSCGRSLPQPYTTIQMNKATFIYGVLLLSFCAYRWFLWLVGSLDWRLVVSTTRGMFFWLLARRW
jgi:hypothetical protein